LKSIFPQRSDSAGNPKKSGALREKISISNQPDPVFFVRGKFIDGGGFKV